MTPKPMMPAVSEAMKRARDPHATDEELRALLASSQQDPEAASLAEARLQARHQERSRATVA